MSTFSHPEHNRLAALPSQQEHALEATLSAVPAAALIVTDARQRITHFNRGAELLFAVGAAEVCGQPLSRLFPHLDEQPPSAAAAPLEQRLLIGQRADGTALVLGAEVARVVGADGSPLTILIPQTPPEDVAPAPTRAALSAQQALLHAVQDAVIVTDPELRILDWNPAAEALYGWPAAEVLGKVASELLPTVYEDTSEAQLREHFLAHGVWKGELTHHHRDGHPIAILVTMAQVRGGDGAPLGLITINRDISKRKRAEAQLRAYAARLELLTKASRAFAEISLDDTTLLERVVQHIAEVLGCLCTITLPSEDGRWLQPAALHDVDPEALAFARATFADTPLAVDDPHPLVQVFHSRQPRLIPAIDPQHLRGVLAPEYWPAIDRFHAHSSVMVPLRVRGLVIGVLGLARHRRNPTPFGEDDLQLVQNLADQAALAIENARLFTRAQHELVERQQTEAQLQLQAARLEILAQASRAFAEAGLHASDLLARIVQHVSETLRCTCALHGLSDDRRWLPQLAVHDTNPERSSSFRTHFTAAPIPTSSPYPAAQVFRSGQPRLVPVVDFEQQHSILAPEDRAVFERFPIRSEVMAPLLVQNMCVGVLILVRFDHDAGPFTESDLRLAQDLADRAALAVENARLFGQVQRELAERARAEHALAAERAELARRVDERTADLSLANAELARAARLKDEFLATMSHELRTPLNSILGRAQALQEAIYGPVTPEQVRALRAVEESGQHLLMLINDILDLSKIESGKLELERGELDVDTLCAMCLRMVKEAAVVKRITLTTTMDGQVELLQADERRLRQILVNLLSNAVKFTPEGGEVGLTIYGDSERGTVTFTVWDTGIGISPDDLPKLFRPFVQIDSRLSRQYTGTGLGLALVLRLTEAHGGSVAVESRPNQGSRFSVSLPWCSAERTAAQDTLPTQALPQALRPAEHPRPDAPAQPQPRILLAEDNEANIAAVSDYLEAQGYQVLIARGGGEAVAQARKQRPDLILMDIQMPGVDGLEATRQIRAEAALVDVPIIALTALAMPGDRERCLAAGASEYLTKPVKLRTLLATITAHLSASPDAERAEGSK